MWTCAETLEQALQAFVRERDAGRMSRRHNGHPLYSRQKSVWISVKARNALRPIHQTDGVRLPLVIQEAFCWFCEQQGRALQVGYPAVPTGQPLPPFGG